MDLIEDDRGAVVGNELDIYSSGFSCIYWGKGGLWQTCLS